MIDPSDYAKQIDMVETISKENYLLKAENERLIKDIAFEKASLLLCQEHLIDMVMQYCRKAIYLDENPSTVNTFSHDFMSAGEGAFGYLAGLGLAKYCDNLIDIYFDNSPTPDGDDVT